MTWLLLDADMLLYQTVAACEVEIEWCQDIITTHLPVKEAQIMFNELLDIKRHQAQCDKFTLCWTADQNFRKEIEVTYKGNRAGNHRRKPVGYQTIRRWAEQQFPSECWHKLEGDDVLGILGTRHPDKCVIWSGDKDLKQIPGLHLDNSGAINHITQLEADVFFYRQILTGDTTDGYPGCPGVGPKTAEKLLPSESFQEASAWRTVIEQYKKKGLGADYALTQARLARILRDSEYTFDEIQLWTPLMMQSDPIITPLMKE
jgi:DNA polymerase-1